MLKVSGLNIPKKKKKKIGSSLKMTTAEENMT